MIARVLDLGSWLVPLGLLLATLVVLWLWLAARPRTALAILMVTLPVHTVLFQVADAHVPGLLVNGLRLWREAVLLALAIGLIQRWELLRQALARHRAVLGAWCLYAVAFLAAAGRAQSVAAALMGLRAAALPMLVFPICLLLPYHLGQLRSLAFSLLGMGIIVSVFALYQGAVIGPSFLWRYYAFNGRLPNAFEVGGSPVQRYMGTFASPNQLSLYLVFLIMLAGSLFMTSKRSRWALFGAGSLYLLVLALTVSRSGWAAFVLGGMALALLWWHRWELWAASLALAGIGAGVLARRGLLHQLRRIVSLQEVSAAYHVAMAQDNLQTILEQPFGFGLGSAGAMGSALAASGQIATVYPTESYILQIGLQSGVPGMAAFGLVVCVAGIGLLRSLCLVRTPFCRALALAAIASLAGAMIHAVMNVDLQDIAVQSYLWFLLAMGLRLPSMEAAASEEVAGA